MLDSKFGYNLFQQKTVSITRSGVEQNNLESREGSEAQIPPKYLVCWSAVSVALQSSSSSSRCEWRGTRGQEVEETGDHQEEEGEKDK